MYLCLVSSYLFHIDIASETMLQCTVGSVLLVEHRFCPTPLTNTFQAKAKREQNCNAVLNEHACCQMLSCNAQKICLRHGWAASFHGIHSLMDLELLHLSHNSGIIMLMNLLMLRRILSVIRFRFIPRLVDLPSYVELLV